MWPFDLRALLFGLLLAALPWAGCRRAEQPAASPIGTAVRDSIALPHPDTLHVAIVPDVTSYFLLRGTPEEIHRTLNRDDDHGLPRMEVAAKTLLEESFLAPEPHRLRAKAKELLEYIQREDTTFSLERMALLADIDSYRAGCPK